MALPAGMEACRVDLHLTEALVDSPSDPDRDPDTIPIADAKVVFRASLNPAVVRIPSADPPTVVSLAPITVHTDANGDLVSPDGQLGVYLIPSTDERLDPHGWPWTVTITKPSIGLSITTTFVTTPGGEIDLGSVVPVPANPGTALLQWETAVTAAQEARDEAVAAKGAAEAAVATVEGIAAGIDPTVAPTPSTVVERTTAGQVRAADPTDSDHAATRGYVEAVAVPDGGVRPVGKGELMLSVLDYGAAGNSNATGTTGTDDRTAIHAAAAVALATGRVLWFPKVAHGYRCGGTVDLPGGIDVQMDSPVITPVSFSGIGLRYNATENFVQCRTLVLRQRRGSVTDWESEGDIGIQTRNVLRSNITIAEVRNNTIGYQRLGDIAGHCYNEIRLLSIDSNKIGVDCETTTVAGWVNEENIYGGNFTVQSSVHTTKSRYGVRIRSTHGYQNNAQIYYKPSFEIGVGISGGAEAVAILVSDGVNNKFLNVRNESNTHLIRTLGTANNNYVSVTYGSGVPSGDAIDDAGSFPTTVVERSRYQQVEAPARLVWSITDIHKRAFPYDATRTNVPGMVMATASNALLFQAVSGFVINDNYLETSTRHIGIQVKTNVVKRFVVSADCEPGYGGRVHIRCYDAAGVIMDPAAHVAAPLVKGSSGNGFSVSTGTGYATGADVNRPQFFSIAPNVDSILLCMTSGTAALRIRSMRVVALDVNTAAAWTPYPANASEPMAVAAPTTGTHAVGRRVYNATPASGQPTGWVCTVAGTPGTWLPFGVL